ncbi:hypothetical protein DWB58_18340, partial [candidate division KSB1 bacterium]|nr:hypothetical protein [candidate division KSB1 bacterium]
EQHERVYVVDQNRDGQMYSLMAMDYDESIHAKLRNIRCYDGLPIPARIVVEGILNEEKN